GFSTSTTGLYVNGSGNVGIGTTTSTAKLGVAGTIESTTGGFKFPNGTTQTAAAPGNSLVWDYTVTATTTSVTSPTLDGNAHGGYAFEFIFYSASAASTIFNFFVNNDQNTANYYNVLWNSGGPAAPIGAAGAAIDDNGANAANISYGTGDIGITPTGRVFVKNYIFRIDTYLLFRTIFKNAAVANLTRLDIVASVANGIGVNSRFRLWRKM
ncbi:hypothetical protein HZB05_01140, partial [Candidatus Wolfebacteria bacterium]|nr:hypothetical protein [Candidatus Wolfebacteria bacterium]